MKGARAYDLPDASSVIASAFAGGGLLTHLEMPALTDCRRVGSIVLRIVRWSAGIVPRRGGEGRRLPSTQAADNVCQHDVRDPAQT
jgi:hypothetical protein